MSENRKFAARQQLLARVETVYAGTFGHLALDIFRYQAAFNPVYAQYLELLGVHQNEVDRLSAIPHLPISLFKKYDLQTGSWTPERVFYSSGTTGRQTSRHLLRDADFYRRNAARGFAAFYGDPANYCFLALLPAYLERTGSSLVFMADDFIRGSGDPDSGFFLSEQDRLMEVIRRKRASGRPVILIGVSFALLDLAERFPEDLSGVIIMETGGMKGRRKEIVRREMHRLLKEAFQVDAIHSEYGMTELLSQAYSKGEGVFYPAPTMRINTRDITDPFGFPGPGKTGAINIIDLANLDTISFIATDDLGRVYPDGSFEVLGRLDNSDVRGCNLLVEG